MSLMHVPNTPKGSTELIFPQAVIFSLIQWTMDAQIAEVTHSKPTLPGGPKGNIYVPSSLLRSFQ